MAANGTRVNPGRFHLNQLPIYAYIVPLSIFMGAPILFIINNALKPFDELFAYPPRFFVEQPTLDNFRRLFQTTATSAVPLTRYVFNTLFVTAVVMLLTLAVGTLCAFALSKIRFWGARIVFETNNLALMFVGTAVTIPSYLVISNLGIMDTYWAHILPLLASPVGMFLVKQFIDQVPNELIEAAQIEGANVMTVYRRIILPLIRPAVATMAMLAFQSVWNNTVTSSLYVVDESLQTLAFYLQTLPTGTVQGAGVSAASTLIMFVPNLVLFVILQSNVMNTMAHSGMK